MSTTGGSGGDVTQTNLAGALGVALNANITDQSVTQTQGGDSCKCSGGGLQAVGQSAWNKQDATADANAFQLKPSNSNTPVSIGDGHDKKHECGCKDEHEGGSGGDVTQTNLAGALGIALNANITDQSVTQTQGGGPGMKDAGYDPKAGYGDMGGYGDKGGYGKKDGPRLRVQQWRDPGRRPVGVEQAGRGRLGERVPALGLERQQPGPHRQRRALRLGDADQRGAGVLARREPQQAQAGGDPDTVLIRMSTWPPAPPQAGRAGVPVDLWLRADYGRHLRPTNRAPMFRRQTQ